MKALDKLYYILKDYGLSTNEANVLLAKFLQEEAVDYIEAMKLCGVTIDDLKESYEENKHYS